MEFRLDNDDDNTAIIFCINKCASYSRQESVVGNSTTDNVYR